MQRRPRSAVLIMPSLPYAAPLMLGVRPLRGNVLYTFCNMDGRIKDTSFDDAQVVFKEFLQKQGHSGCLLWLFREDVISDKGKYFIKIPKATENERRAKECYELGRRRGFGVALHGFCLLDNCICCYIQLPEDDLDSQYKLMPDVYVKYSVVESIKKGQAVRNPVLWSMRKWKNKKKKQVSFIDDMPSKKNLLPIFERNGV
jgi:hypothetical protein